ncbi:hypothetical protein ebA3256 [Aromatoleum aromaticum EbN1]|nr:hypothetical protein ebA3256 [Aromatoleum aromaticum EbN1]
MTQSHCTPCSTFQSTPPVTEGRCMFPEGQVVKFDLVSIHAPRHRGAMPHGCRGSRTPAGGFNPRPPSPRGDAQCRLGQPRRTACFNPRPPSPRGDALERLPADQGQPVSIHAPRHRGAMHRSSSFCGVVILFQSTPPVTEGRCQAGARLFAPQVANVSIHAPRHRGAMPE